MFTDIMWNSWTNAKKKIWTVLNVCTQSAAWGAKKSRTNNDIYIYGTIMYVTLTLNISQQIAKLIVKSYIYLNISLLLSNVIILLYI